MILDKKMQLSKFIKGQQGATTIEFALLFLPFFIMVAVIIEASLLVYQISLVEHSVSKAAKYASTFKGEVKEKFEEFIEKDEKNFLAFMNDDSALEIDVKYCKNLKELEENDCDGDEKDSLIAIYNAKYKINPIFPISRAVMDDEFMQSRAMFFIEGSKIEVKKDDKSSKSTKK